MGGNSGTGTITKWNNIDLERYLKYKLNFRYSNGTTANQTANITVNDQAVGSVTFAPASGTSTWKTASLTVTLKKGNNTIRLTASGKAPNLDQVVVSPYVTISVPVAP